MQTRASNRLKGLHLYLAISSLVNLATWVLLLLPNFLQQKGWSGQGIGWAMGAYFSVNLVSQIIAGEIADRRGSVKTALAGVGVGVASGVLYVFAGWWTWLIIPARLFHGAAAGLISSGALIELTQSVPMERKGQVIGYFGLPGFVMIGIGPLLAEWLVYIGGFQTSFLLILVSFALTGWLLLRLPQSLVDAPASRTPFYIVLKASFVRLKRILVFSIFFGLCFSCWNGFLAPTVRGLGAGAVSSFGTGYALGAVVTRLGLSHSMGTHRRRLIAISSLFAYGAGLVLIPHAYASWNLLVIGAVCGMGHGIYYPSLSSLAAERFHPLYQGQGMSLYVSASGLGHFMGPPIWGALADKFGYSLIFLLSGSLLALAVATFVTAESRRGPHGQARPNTG
ncbi:MAG: MFS transporter [Acidobacteria bacterium]|nr:MAG: MFS transporter [Acidobacteriota bacterium]